MIRLRFSFILALMLAFSSCNNWLDVQPEASVSAEKLFSTQEGFCEAVNGIYTRASDNMLYGGLFTCEIQDVMMQNYSFQVQDYTNYQKTAVFDFNDGMFRWRVNSIWDIAYNAIANCNLLLKYIDSRRNLFSAGMYEIIKGEVLALRAYLHFDILRLFAPHYESSTAVQKFIPYVREYSNRVTPLSSMTETLNLAIADLTEAKRLLKQADPILKSDYVAGYPYDDTDVEQNNPELFMQNRRHRLNYYAVCGTLARVFLYKGVKDSAQQNALEVINSGKFPWVNPTDFLANYQTFERDRIIYTELLFGWYIPQHEANMSNRYLNVVTGYFVNTDYLNRIYETSTVGGEDYRYKGWFIQSETSNTSMQIIKYLRNPTSTGNRHYLVAPAIRLSEMYYIASECSGDAQYINTVRQKRGIGAPVDVSRLNDELLAEYRKETYGEGQAFFAYKRMNRSITAENGTTYEHSRIYTIALPENEIEFGNR
ncbi:MAG: RagB/SusD family nutrient uptake outer membrane protein [Prevotellaceae bacterium]|jgi:hypothetical protein|nr:RagB/SusD family nutrient uptake outer membrane protein [Prevotellaceae bacterium]